MKRWLTSALLAVLLVLGIVWAIGSALHMNPDPAESITFKPDPEGPPLRPEYAEKCLALKARTEKIIDGLETRSCQVDEDCTFISTHICWFGSLIPVNTQSESVVINALDYYWENVGKACGSVCSQSRQSAAMAFCKDNICQAESMPRIGKPSAPDYPHDDALANPKIEQEADLRGSVDLLNAQEITTPGVVIKSEDTLSVVSVPRYIRERCEGWVEITFKSAQNIVDGSFEIVDSKPPGKYDRDAIQALLDMYSLEKYSPARSKLTTREREDGDVERVFTFYTDCGIEVSRTVDIE